jgi:2,5-diketo-D-gluconate reductase B
METMKVVEANGARIPALGLGTWQLTGKACARLVEQALRLGYRHIDTAQAYENEEAVGEGLHASGVSRKDIFVTTKIWYTRLAPTELERAVKESLVRMRLTELDLVLVHWPNPQVPLAETMGALAKVKRAGLVRHIGVSNFTVALLDEAVKVCPEPLVTNQVEYHPYLDQSKVIAACRRHGLSVTAYSPIARGRATDNKVLARIAAAHGKSEAQVSLRWLMQQDVIAIPRTSKVERLSENMAIFDFELSEDEMKEIASLARPDGRVVNVAWAPNWD